METGFWQGFTYALTLHDLRTHAMSALGQKQTCAVH